jgi:hypothetical protein
MLKVSSQDRTNYTYRLKGTAGATGWELDIEIIRSCVVCCIRIQPLNDSEFEVADWFKASLKVTYRYQFCHPQVLEGLALPKSAAKA